MLSLLLSSSSSSLSLFSTAFSLATEKTRDFAVPAPDSSRKKRLNLCCLVCAFFFFFYGRQQALKSMEMFRQGLGEDVDAAIAQDDAGEG